MDKLCFSFFFSRTFTNHRTGGEGGGHFFNASLPLPPASQTLRHQPGDYCRELNSAHSQQPDSIRESIRVSECKSLTTKLRALLTTKLRAQWVEEFISVDDHGAKSAKGGNPEFIILAKSNLKKAVKYLLHNCYFKLWNWIFRQVLGIPMSSDFCISMKGNGFFS